MRSLPRKNAHVFTDAYKKAFKAHLAVMAETPETNIRKLVFDAFNAGWKAKEANPPRSDAT